MCSSRYAVVLDAPLPSSLPVKVCTLLLLLARRVAAEYNVVPGAKLGILDIVEEERNDFQGTDAFHGKSTAEAIKSVSKFVFFNQSLDRPEHSMLVRSAAKRFFANAT
jgi:hypothetical protein